MPRQDWNNFDAYEQYADILNREECPYSALDDKIQKGTFKKGSIQDKLRDLNGEVMTNSFPYLPRNR